MRVAHYPKPFGPIFASRENPSPGRDSCRGLFAIWVSTMREDMYKVIVERPRRGKDGDANAKRLRNDKDGPTRLGTRAGYGHRSLNENLAPLRRYLHAQVGRPWNKVFSEICAGIDRRNTVQQHIHQHIGDFIAINVEVRDGHLVDLAERWGFLRTDAGITQELYVDPNTGLIRRNKSYRSWRHHAAERERRKQADIATRRRIVDERTVFLLLDDVWYCVEVDTLPQTCVVQRIIDGKPRRQVVTETRYDVVLRRNVSRAVDADVRRCNYLYGSGDRYAVSKRQISTREIKAHQLPRPLSSG